MKYFQNNRKADVMLVIMLFISGILSVCSAYLIDSFASPAVRKLFQSLGLFDQRYGWIWGDYNLWEWGLEDTQREVYEFALFTVPFIIFATISFVIYGKLLKGKNKVE